MFESNTRNQKKKRDLLFGAGEAFANNFALKGATFFESEPFVVLGKTSLPLFVHHQYESDPHLLSTLPSFTSANNDQLIELALFSCFCPPPTLDFT